MSFSLSKKVNPARVFIEKKNNVTARWDPHYHSPRFAQLDPELDAIDAKPLRKISAAIFSGITPLSGGDAYTEDPKGIAFIRSGDFNEDGTINEDALIRLKPEIHQKLMRRSQLAANDILFAIVGATIGKVGVFSGGYEANINQAVCAVRPSDGILPHFMHAFFLTNLGQEQIERIKRPVARANINLEEVGTLRLPLLESARQGSVVQALLAAFAQKVETEKKATSLLATVDDVLLDELGIACEAESPNTLPSRIFKSQFAELTGQRWDPLYHQADVFHFVRDAKCDLKSLGSQAEYFITGFPAGRGDQVNEEDGGVIQIRPTNLSNDRELVFRRNVFIASAELKTRKADVLKRGEVLFNNTNSQEQVGKTVWFDLEENYFSSNHITRIATNSSCLNAQYLAAVLNLYQRRRVFFKLCTNWNNQSGVGADILQRIPVPVPKPTRQTAIVARLETVRDKARALREQARVDLEKAKRDIEALILGKEAAE